MHHHPTEPFIKPNSQGLTEKQLPHRPSWVFAVCGKVKPADVFFFRCLAETKKLCPLAFGDADGFGNQNSETVFFL